MAILSPTSQGDIGRFILPVKIYKSKLFSLVCSALYAILIVQSVDVGTSQGRSYGDIGAQSQGSRYSRLPGCLEVKGSLVFYL
jgi:hypothetical protein